MEWWLNKLLKIGLIMNIKVGKNYQSYSSTGTRVNSTVHNHTNNKTQTSTQPLSNTIFITNLYDSFIGLYAKPSVFIMYQD